MTISQAAAWTALAFFPVMMVFAGLMDVMTMKIRNRLVVGLVLGYAVLAPLAGIALDEMGLSLALAGGVFLAGFTLFSMGWIGGGDAKLATATVLWLGAAHVVPYLVYTALFGGALTLSVLVFRQVELPEYQEGGWNVPEWAERLHSPQAGVPYGAAMASAALMVFPHTPWMAAII
ncbi:MAG TPA: prepilin peptidase [Aestuariivirgaceae bacterium]|nr:prepilin peptidase [Aestuariivirgaceae bacterium]